MKTWKNIADSYIAKCQQLMKESKFLYRDINLLYLPYIPTKDQVRRMMASKNLLDIIDRETDKFPRACRGYIRHELVKQYKKQTGFRYGAFYRKCWNPIMWKILHPFYIINSNEYRTE